MRKTAKRTAKKTARKAAKTLGEAPRKVGYGELQPATDADFKRFEFEGWEKWDGKSFQCQRPRKMARLHEGNLAILLR